MVASTGIRDAIAMLSDLQRLGLSQTQGDTLSTEWRDRLPTLTAPEQDRIDRIKQRYEPAHG